MSDQKELILLLTSCTINGEVKWEAKQMPLSRNRYEANFKGIYLAMQWLLDESPSLVIRRADGATEVISGYQLKQLARFVREQCETPEVLAQRAVRIQEARERLLKDNQRKEEFIAEVLKILAE